MVRSRGERRQGEAAAAAEEEDAARQRLALLRVLIWAEREAESQRRPDVADRLREAIIELMPRRG